jgi:hypothetical protein
MPQRHHSRRLTTFFVVVSLLFAQLAWAAYVCPANSLGDTSANTSASTSANTSAKAMTARMAAGEPCAGMDDIQPALCHQHAFDPAQSAETAQPPVVLSPALLQTVPTGALPLHGTTLALPASARAQAWPPPDPVFLTTLRLRV